MIGNSHLYECFAVCRHCGQGSIARVLQALATGDPMSHKGSFLSADDAYLFLAWVFEVPGSRTCPDYVPTAIERIFDEAALCLAINAWDAAGTMFRKVLDAATRERTPQPNEGDVTTPPWKVYKDLRLRLDWLFERNVLNPSLVELSSCIHQDGNDAAHDLVGIGQDAATDLADFTEVVLETIYTIPGRIAASQERRDERRRPR